MSKAAQIKRLQSLAQMVLDAKLTDLRQSAQARANTIAHLNDLKPAGLMMSDDSGVAEAVAALSYQQWADMRRADLNQRLAQQTAQWLDARDVARLAFGKSEVLRALAQRKG